MKSEIFAKILSVVSEVTELSAEEILSATKTDDRVAARCIFVHHCAAYGIPSVAIAKFLGRKKVGSVNNYLQNYHDYRRCSMYFRLMADQVDRILSSTVP